MDFTNKEKIAFLETLVEEYYTQGDSYVARQNKSGSWTFGYSNDYELQHGVGENMTMPNKMVEILMERDNQVKNLSLCAVSDTEGKLQAIEDLKDWCYDTCNGSTRDEMYEIMERL